MRAGLLLCHLGRTAVALLLFLVIRLPVASAEPAPPPSSGRADGDPLRPAGTGAGNQAGAREQLTGAYRALPTAEILYRLAMLAEAEQRSVEAADLYRRFLGESSCEDRTACAQAQARLRLPITPAGEVTVAGPRGALVFVDNRLAGALPLTTPLLLTPGLHGVTIEYGRKSLSEEVKALAGRQLELRFEVSSGVAVVTAPPTLLVRQRLTGLPAGAGERLLRALEQAVSARELRTQAESAALLQTAGEQARIRGCLEEPSCQQELAAANLAQGVLTLGVEVLAGTGPRWQLAVALVDSRAAGVVAARRMLCDPCGSESAAAVVGRAVTEVLSEAARRTTGMLALTSRPSGATVTLAGQRLGQTPLERPVWSGELLLQLRLPGYLPMSSSVQLAVGESKLVELSLSPVPLRRSRWRLVSGSLAAGLGLSLVGLAVAALAVHDRCVTPDAAGYAGCQVVEGPPGQRQILRYDSSGVGVGLLVPGLVLSVLGGVLAGLPPRPRRATAN